MEFHYQGKYRSEISFPLGGIGTGSIGLSGYGELRDWEIFNRPNIGSWFKKTFPLIRWQSTEQDSEAQARVLLTQKEAPLTPIDGGAWHANAEGFPQIQDNSFQGEFPIAQIQFKDNSIPLDISLKAFNPFIPGDSEASSLPVAILHYEIKNNSSHTMDVAILYSMLNMIGAEPEALRDRVFRTHESGLGENVNEELDMEKVKGLFFSTAQYNETHPKFGTITLLGLKKPKQTIESLPYWPQKRWFASIYEIWNEFKNFGRVPVTGPRGSIGPESEAGAVLVKQRLAPNETTTFSFVIGWYFPNFEKYWANQKIYKDLEKPTWKNHYAIKYPNLQAVINHLIDNLDVWEEFTNIFHDLLFNSTYPAPVVDAVASNLSTLKSATVQRLPNGALYGFEGTSQSYGWCEGSCTHVWGYQQAVPFLFGDLQRSMHETNYQYNMVDEIGALQFRLQLPLDENQQNIGLVLPCADGQLGGVMQFYRDWKICGDLNWLKQWWPSVKTALEFAWEDWDEEKDGILTAFQHNTYDVNFLGPNPMLSGFYLGALLAGEQMAKAMGDEESAKEYRRVFEKGRNWINTNLFNGEYFIQQYDKRKATYDQIGSGCLIDQLVGQWHASLYGLGYIFTPEHTKSTLQAIMKYNFKDPISQVENGARLYATSSEKAVVICSWPKGGRPEIPFPYADEVMTGFEYQFASHLITEGFVDEGIKVTKAIRDRFDGWRRNPWDEFECGHHYARAMASYGLLLSLSGFHFDRTDNMVGFEPVINQENFATFWSLGMFGEISDRISVRSRSRQNLELSE